MGLVYTGGRVLFEHVLNFFPKGEDVYFVAYHKADESFLNGQKQWTEEFGPECVFQHEVEDIRMPVDLIVMADFLNHLFTVNQLEIFALFQYTTLSDRIEYDYPLLDGHRDFKTILEMISE